MNEHSQHVNKDGLQETTDPFLQKVRQELDHSCDALDGHTLSRLNKIRNQALERKHVRRRAMLLPFGGLVTACVLVLSISVMNRTPVSPLDIPAASPLEDLEILSSSESLDFFEDFEFYQWLAENEISA